MAHTIPHYTLLLRPLLAEVQQVETAAVILHQRAGPIYAPALELAPQFVESEADDEARGEPRALVVPGFEPVQELFGELGPAGCGGGAEMENGTWLSESGVLCQDSSGYFSCESLFGRIRMSIWVLQGLLLLLLLPQGSGFRF